MITSRFFINLLSALALVFSFTAARSAGAISQREENSTAPTPPLLLNIQSIDSGGGHTCVVTDAGGVKCWGANFSGEIGDGTTYNRLAPMNVFGLSSGIQAVSTGSEFSCALTVGGDVKCWGKTIMDNSVTAQPSNDINLSASLACRARSSPLPQAICTPAR